MQNINIEITAVKARKGVWILSTTLNGRELKTTYCGFNKKSAVKNFKDYVLSKQA